MRRLAVLIGFDRLLEAAGAVAARTGGRSGQGGRFPAPATLPARPGSAFERAAAARAPADIQCLLQAGFRPHGGAQSSRIAQGSQACLKSPARPPIFAKGGLLPGLNTRREPWQTSLVTTRLAIWSTTFSGALS